MGITAMWWLARLTNPASRGIKDPSAQGAERGAQFRGEQGGLFPGGEVPAPVDLVVVDEVGGVGAFGPAARGLVQLVGEDADAKGSVMFLASKNWALFSQYRRAAETPVLVSQYRVMLSSTSSRVSAPGSSPSTTLASSPGCPLPSPWSSMNAARSTGESARPYRVCGRVVMIWAYATCWA